MAKSAVVEKKLQDINHGYETDAKNSHKHLRLWLRLLTCTSLLENEVRSRLKGAFGETLAQFDLMAQLDRRPQGLKMTELSRRLMVTNGNITGLVDRLIRRRMVERIPSPTDRRILTVVLTPTGKSLFRTMAARHERWIKDLLSGLSGTEVDSLMGLLETARESVRSEIKRSQEQTKENKTTKLSARKKAALTAAEE